MMALHPLVHHVSEQLLSCLAQAQDQLRCGAKMLKKYKPALHFVMILGLIIESQKQFTELWN